MGWFENKKPKSPVANIDTLRRNFYAQEKIKKLSRSEKEKAFIRFLNQR